MDCGGDNMPWMEYKGYQIIYEENNGKVIVKTANYKGIQCTYGKTFDSMNDLKKYIDNGGWAAGSKIK